MLLYNTIVQALEPILGARTQNILLEGLQRLGTKPEQIELPQAEVLLKRVVYRELQTKMPAGDARSLVERLLSQIQRDNAPASLPQLEAGLKRFGLYLDWPEVGRLRGVVNVLRKQGLDDNLLREGQSILHQLEDHLQSTLLRQARDLADLEASFNRVQSVGGPKLRRLEALIRQIKDAQSQDTIAQAEVEQARSIAADLRKLVESSVVQNPTIDIRIETMEAPPISLHNEDAVVLVTDETGEFQLDLDLESLSQEQQDRIREIDLAEQRRQLDTLRERYAAILSHRQVAQWVSPIMQALESGELQTEALVDLENDLRNTFQDVLSQTATRLNNLIQRLETVAAGVPSERSAPLKARLGIASETLQAGGIPTDLNALENEIEELAQTLKAEQAAQARRSALQQALQELQTEAQKALASAKNPAVQQFMQALAAAPPSEENLQALRNRFSALLTELSREREEESLRRQGLRMALEALPVIEALEPQRQQLIQQLGSLPITQAESFVEALSEHTRKHLAAILHTLSQQAQRYEVQVPEIAAAQNAMASGAMPNPAPLEQALRDAVIARRKAVLEELSTLENSAQSFKGVGGEEVLQQIAALKSQAQSGHPIQLDPVHQSLQKLRQQQESLRNSLSLRVRQLLQDFKVQEEVTSNTVLLVKPRIEFLASAIERLPKLGPSGLVEIQRALTEAEPLMLQLAQEYEAAQALKQELKGADLESLLDVFSPIAKPTAPPTKSNTVSPAQLEALLGNFHMRGVEGVGLVSEVGLDSGQLPLPVGAALSLIRDLQSLSQEVSGSTRLVVLSLDRSVLILVPLKKRHLVLMAEKALLSRLLGLIEKQRPELAAL